MLIDIIRMPPVFGIPLDRRLTVNVGGEDDGERRASVAYWPRIPFSPNVFSVGSAITRTPSHLYKAIHISQDDRYVFETVFSVEPFGHPCLYTKIISFLGSTIGISLSAIQQYQLHHSPIMPTSHVIIPQDVTNIIDNIVPPVFGERSLWRFAHRLIDIKAGGHFGSSMGQMFKPIYEHAPFVMDALAHGHFSRSPFAELPGHHPAITLPKDKWFSYEELSYSMIARGIDSHLNHPEFDNVALSLIMLGPAKYSVSSSIANAVDGISDLWLTREYDDPYHFVLRGASSNNSWFQSKLSDVFSQCAQIYCELYHINPSVFYNVDVRNSSDQSSVTITKNLHDEVAVTFHDIIHDRYVCFYTSFPAIALATLSAGISE